MDRLVSLYAMCNYWYNLATLSSPMNCMSKAISVLSAGDCFWPQSACFTGWTWVEKHPLKNSYRLPVKVAVKNKNACGGPHPQIFGFSFSGYSLRLQGFQYGLSFPKSVELPLHRHWSLAVKSFSFSRSCWVNTYVTMETNELRNMHSQGMHIWGNIFCLVKWGSEFFQSLMYKAERTAS